MYALAIDPKQPSNLYVGAYGGGVWKSTDGGATWRRLPDLRDDSHYVRTGVSLSDLYLLEGLE